MQQRLALCRVLLHDPELLLLDEPYSSLDSDASRLVDDLLSELAGRRTFAVATHDPGRLQRLATEALALA
jgi:ABC-type multidrug transport system ATPase subunit